MHTHRRATFLVLFGAAIAAIFWPGAADAQRRPAPDDEATERARAEWFLSQRRYPTDAVPVEAYRRGVAQYRSLLARGPARASVLGGSSAGGWTPIGPSVISPGGADSYTGRVNGVAIDPRAPATLYVASSHGGLWKTTDGGATWKALLDAQCGTAMATVTLDPVNPDIVYAGTGSYPYYYGCGLLRSTDGGATWTNLDPEALRAPFQPQTAVTLDEVIVPRGTAGTTSATLVARTNAGIYRSTDGGASWSHPLSTGWFYPVTSIVADPNDERVMYAAAYDAYASPSAKTGVFKSLDGGASWARLEGAPQLTDAKLAISHSQPALVYLTGHAPTGWGGVWLTGDGGANWTKRPMSSRTDLTWFRFIAVDPKAAGTLYLGDVSLYKSTDSAATASTLQTNVHVDYNALAFVPNSAVTYLAGDAGVYRSTDGGASWGSLNSGLTLTEFYPGIAVERAHPSHIIGGSQDNGIDEYSGSGTWSLASSGDGGYGAVDFRNPQTAYAEVQWVPNSWYSGPLRRDGTGYFTRKISGIDMSELGDFIPPLVMDPVNPAVLYFGTKRLYRTTDRGESWSAISGDLSKGFGVIHRIAVSPADPKTVWVGTNDGNVQVTRDGGTSWTNVTGSLPNRVIGGFALDATDPAVAVVVLSGFGSSHVFRTESAGASWQDISGNFPDIPANTAVLIPNSGTVQLFVGTDLGILLAGAHGGTWAVASAGMPTVPVMELAFDAPSGTLVAATHGRGMYTLAYSAPLALRGDVNGDGALGAADAQAILAAVVGLPVPNGWSVSPNGDANCDGKISALDAQIVLSAAVGLDVSKYCVNSYR